MILKKLIIILILSSVTTVFADDLIVDKNSLNQYEQDNYAHFNSFNFHGEYQGNNKTTIPPKPSYISDRINLPETIPILGNQFTIEAMVYSKAHPLLLHRTIIGNDINPNKSRYRYSNKIRESSFVVQPTLDQPEGSTHKVHALFLLCNLMHHLCPFI